MVKGRLDPDPDGVYRRNHGKLLTDKVQETTLPSIGWAKDSDMDAVA